MKKKLISVMLCAAMATTMFSSVAVHAEGDDERDGGEPADVHHPCRFYS